jgi:hypothetical protein
MKNSLACIIFKEKKINNFCTYFKAAGKWENYKKISYQKSLVVL